MIRALNLQHRSLLNAIPIISVTPKYNIIRTAVYTSAIVIIDVLFNLTGKTRKDRVRVGILCSYYVYLISYEHNTLATV